MQRSKFEEFLEENIDIKVAAEKCANDFLGKDASEKAKENVVVIFMMGAVWQANEYVKRLNEKRNGKQ